VVSVYRRTEGTAEPARYVVRWGLHKFRKTYATMHSEAGVSAPTIQRWLGHSELPTTLRYLARAEMRSERTRSQGNATFAGLAIGGASNPR
jgi:integrase/recombinase XerD